MLVFSTSRTQIHAFFFSPRAQKITLKLLFYRTRLLLIVISVFCKVVRRSFLNAIYVHNDVAIWASTDKAGLGNKKNTNYEKRRDTSRVSRKTDAAGAFRRLLERKGENESLELRRHMKLEQSYNLLRLTDEIADKSNLTAVHPNSFILKIMTSQ